MVGNTLQCCWLKTNYLLSFLIWIGLVSCNKHTEYGIIASEKELSDQEINRIHASQEDRAKMGEIITNTPLIQAAKNGKVRSMEVLLDAKANVEATDENGNTALHWASKNSQAEAVTLLIRYGANIEAKNNKDERPIDLIPDVEPQEIKGIFAQATTRQSNLTDSIRSGNEAVVKSILEWYTKLGKIQGIALLKLAAYNSQIKIVTMLQEKGIDINGLGINSNNGTLLHDAVIEGDKNTIDTLINAGANIEAKNAEGNTPLFSAVEYGQTESIQLLLSAQANIEATNNRRDTPLLFAVEYNQVAIVQMLLDKHAHTEAKDNLGDTSLHRAIDRGSTKMVDMLLKANANIEATDNRGDTPLHRSMNAVNKRHVKVIDILLKANANVEAKNRAGATPLWIAANHGDLPIVHMLLKVSGINKETKEMEISGGSTPMGAAASRGHIEVLQALIAAGADKEAKNEVGFTPLLMAINNRELEAIKILIEAKANIEATDKNGMTGLHLAAYHGYVNVAELLINFGANKEAKDNNGNTPILSAASNGQSDVLDFLISQQTNITATNNDEYDVLSVALKGNHNNLTGILLNKCVTISPKVIQLLYKERCNKSLVSLHTFTNQKLGENCTTVSSSASRNTGIIQDSISYFTNGIQSLYQIATGSYGESPYQALGSTQEANTKFEHPSHMDLSANSLNNTLSIAHYLFAFWNKEYRESNKKNALRNPVISDDVDNVLLASKVYDALEKGEEVWG